MTTGSVIVLNGPSSSGKTTLAVELQRQFAAAGECWFVYAMDDYFAKVPFDWVTAGKHVGPHADEGVVLEVVDGVFQMRLGPIGRRVLAAWRGAVGSAARAGLNVIADDVVLTEEEWQGWQVELDGVDAHWVRVQIALDVLEAREQARGDRMPGQAQSQYEDAYRYPTYDAEVDTGRLDAQAAAAAVLAGWRARTVAPPISSHTVLIVTTGGSLGPDDESDGFERAVDAVRAGADAGAEAKALFDRLTDDERLGLLDGDTPFWPGLQSMMVDGYNLRPYVHGEVARLGIPGTRFVDGLAAASRGTGRRSRWRWRAARPGTSTSRRRSARRSAARSAPRAATSSAACASTSLVTPRGARAGDLRRRPAPPGRDGRGADPRHRALRDGVREALRAQQHGERALHGRRRSRRGDAARRVPPALQAGARRGRERGHGVVQRRERRVGRAEPHPPDRGAARPVGVGRHHRDRLRVGHARRRRRARSGDGPRGALRSAAGDPPAPTSSTRGRRRGPRWSGRACASWRRSCGPTPRGSRPTTSPGSWPATSTEPSPRSGGPIDGAAEEPGGRRCPRPAARRRGRFDRGDRPSRHGGEPR